MKTTKKVPKVVSYAPEVVADNSGAWTGNGLRFERREDAQRWAFDLAGRWTLVREFRVVESSDPVNRKAGECS